MSFPEFVERYKRDYVPGSDEYKKHESLFAKRVAAVHEHNCDPSRASTWRASVNNLADWTDEALDRLSGTNYTPSQAPLDLRMQQYNFLSHRGRTEAFPSSVSWGHLSSIQHPRHQGHCGSCWALTAVTVLSAHLEKRNALQNLSVGQVIACAPNPRRCGGTGGCHGATSGLAFNYILHAGLVASEKFPYPYGDPNFRPSFKEDVLKCPPSMALKQSKAELSLQSILSPDGSEVHRFSRGHGHDLGMVGWKRLPENREQQLVRALVEEGPVAASIATGEEWRMYGGGIFPSKHCDKKRVLKHANVIFGYGVDQTWSMRYWLLKNSWGEDWGEHGTMRLQRQDDEEADCGWDDHPEKGSECAGGRDRIWVCGSCGLIHEVTLPIFE